MKSNPSNWPAWITGASRDADLSNSTAQGQALQQFFGNGFFAYFVFQNPNWDFHTLNFTSDVTLTDEDLAPILNSTDPDLRPLRAHGAKIIHYVRWADSAIAPANSVNYYDSVRAELASVEPGRQSGDRWEEIQEFYRLFMVPGMAHCGGGDGPNAFGNGTSNGPIIDADHDLLKALERWVEQGVASDKIIATHYLIPIPVD